MSNYRKVTKLAWAYAAFGKGGVEILYKVNYGLRDLADSTRGGGGVVLSPFGRFNKRGGAVHVK